MFILQSPSLPSPPSLPTPLSLAERSLVIARISVSWASAIILTSCGYILTNAHLLKPYLDIPTQDSNIATSGIPSPRIDTMIGNIILRTDVWIRLDAHHHVQSNTTTASRWYKAHVVYLSHGVWDIALLKIDLTTALHPITFPHPAQHDIHTGQDIFVMGHALFAPPASLRPTITRGGYEHR